MSDVTTNPNEQLSAPSRETAELERSVPLGVGGFEDTTSVNPLGDGIDGGSRVNTTSLLIAVVVVVAAGALFSMRKLATLATPSDTNKEIEERVDRFVEEMTGGTNGGWKTGGQGDSHTILTVLSEDYQGKQVQVSHVKKNPFILPGQQTTVAAAVELEPVDAMETDEAILLRRQAERTDKLSALTTSFQLKSVLMGSTPLANLNDEIVRVGDTVVFQEESFDVVTIDSDLITLLFHDEALELKIEVEVHLARD